MTGHEFFCINLSALELSRFAQGAPGGNTGFPAVISQALGQPDFFTDNAEVYTLVLQNPHQAIKPLLRDTGGESGHAVAARIGKEFMVPG